MSRLSSLSKAAALPTWRDKLRSDRAPDATSDQRLYLKTVERSMLEKLSLSYPEGLGDPSKARSDVFHPPPRLAGDWAISRWFRALARDPL